MGGGSFGFGSAGELGAFESLVVGDNAVVTASALIAANAAAVAANFRAAVFGDLRLCALNHRRRASSETTTPSLPSPSRIARIGAPSRRIFSSSARWASSCEVLGFFGRRDSVTNWASVRLAVGWQSLSGGVVVVKWRELYSRRFRGAMGALWVGSKPRGLDVGVLTYGFLLFYLKTFSSVRLLRARNELCARLDGLIKNSVFETGSWMRFDGIIFVGANSEEQKDGAARQRPGPHSLD